MRTIQARASASCSASSLAPSNTGVIARKPSVSAAQPNCVSRICPKFIRLGTPIGESTTSIGVPSGRCGMSSTGRIVEITPLLPCRPAILSPTCSLRRSAIVTRTCCSIPAGSSSDSSRVKIRTSTTVPCTPCGTRSDVSFTSRAFSPKIARSSFSSAVNSVSPFGVILPTRMSPGSTSAPIRTIPSASSWPSDSSATFGMSRVISSLPSFVSRAPTSCFDM